MKTLVALSIVGIAFFSLQNDFCHWALIQVLRSIFGRSLLESLLDSRESTLWATWEHMYDRKLNTAESTLLPIQTITSLDQLNTVDLSLPLLAKNMSSADALTIQDMLTPPLSELEIDYFRDAREKNTVPNARGKIKDIVTNIVNGGVEKFGSQMILKAFPVVMERFLSKNEWLVKLFGKRRVDNWRGLGTTVTVPVFMSRGRKLDPDGNSLEGTTRTDLHCEPISNLVTQTVGRKVWTLVEPRYSYLLKPTVAPDGRAYFYSSLDPLDPSALSHIPRYEVITEEGDSLYVPTWTWHRVQYLPDTVAVSISIFEFVAWDFVANNPVFAVTLVPNLVKEFFGIKTQ